MIPYSRLERDWRPTRQGEEFMLSGESLYLIRDRIGKQVRRDSAGETRPRLAELSDMIRRESNIRKREFRSLLPD